MSEESVHFEEEHYSNGNGDKKRTWEEEIRVGSDELIGKVQELMRDAAVRKITIKDENGKKLLSFPLYAGVLGVVVAGPWTALALVAAWFARFSIIIERDAEEPVEKQPEESGEAGA